MIDEMYAHASEAHPQECCGVIGGSEGVAQTLYRLHNVAGNPLNSYNAAPEDLFAAQRKMRENRESLVAIYHSHPKSRAPLPSQTDVRLAFYPQAVHFILGGHDPEPAPAAFRLFERENRWERVDYKVIEVDD